VEISRKRKREAGAMEVESASLRRHMAPDGDGRTTPFGGAGRIEIDSKTH
jgi:hypothetical protein